MSHYIKLSPSNAVLAMNPMLIASGGIDGGTMILAILILVAIVAACTGIILLSLWLTFKVNGSRGLVWGAVLGVVTVYFRPLLGLLLGHWGHFSFLYESLLPSAAAASTLACIINLITWKRNCGPVVSEMAGDVQPDN